MMCLLGSEIPYDSFLEFLKHFGTVRGLALIFIIAIFFTLIWLVQRMYFRNITDKQDQINRLAAENKEYRDRFLKILDEKHK